MGGGWPVVLCEPKRALGSFIGIFFSHLWDEVRHSRWPRRAIEADPSVRDAIQLRDYRRFTGMGGPGLERTPP